MQQHRTVLLVFILSLLAVCSYAPAKLSYRPITNSNGWYTNPDWSPDGQQALAQFRADGQATEQLVIIQVKGGEQATLPIQDLSAVSLPKWLDDHSLAFLRSKLDLSRVRTDETLFTYDRTRKQESQSAITNLNINDMSWNAAKQQWAISFEASDDHAVLALIDPTSGSATVLYDPPPNSRIENVAWDRSGGDIAYVVVIESDATESDRKWQLEKINVLTQARMTLMDTSTPLSSPTWSPDNAWIAIHTVDSNQQTGYRSQIMLLSSDGSTRRLIESHDSIEPTTLSWSPVEDVMIVTSLGEPGRNALYLLDVSLDQKTR